MQKLCTTAIAKRREYGKVDSTIHAHLWKLTLDSYENFMNPRNHFEIEMLRRRIRHHRRIHDDDDSATSQSSWESEDSDGDENENRYRPSIVVTCPQEHAYVQADHDPDYDNELLESSENLSEAYLSKGTILTVEYDYGSTTTLYLKVLSVRHAVVNSLLQYFTREASQEDLTRSLKAVPAYSLPKENQIDAYYPYLSKIIMGKYVPVIQTSDGQQDPHDYSLRTSELRDNVTSAITLGKSACIRSEQDVQFCTIEGCTGQELMRSIQMKDFMEFLEVAEQAWTPIPKEEDENNLSDIQYDWIYRHLVEEENEEMYNMYLDMQKEGPGFGPQVTVFRRKKNKECKSSTGFDFQKLFPLTYAMFHGQYFRWFKLKNSNLLHVLVGRAEGSLHREYNNHQILKSWRYDFQSFHEVLCAVEASWVWQGRKMTSDTFLPEYDSFIGPSHPCKDPPVLVKEEECVMITSQQDLKKLVYALAITEENGKAILYSGYDDGTLSKWCLDDNSLIWSKVIYSQSEQNEEERSSSWLELRYTYGVADSNSSTLFGRIKACYLDMDTCTWRLPRKRF